MKRMYYTHFTLVELIVSMAIFLIILLILATMLSDTVKLSRKRKQQADVYHQQQILSTIFSRDIENMVASNEPGEDAYLQFTTSNAAFVTTSTIGVDQSAPKTTPLNGVLYTLESDSNLYRGVFPLPTPYPGQSLAWTGLITDSDVIAENVKSFIIEAYWPGEISPRTYATGELPALISIKVVQLDEHDTDRNDTVKESYRVFEKRIFITGSN